MSVDYWYVPAEVSLLLQFEVHRPPVPGDDAFTAARQLLAQSRNTDILQRELAIAITAGDAWFVHDRP